MPEDTLRKTQDPPAPRWPVRTPQVQPTLRNKGPFIGSSLTPKGAGGRGSAGSKAKQSDKSGSQGFAPDSSAPGRRRP